MYLYNATAIALAGEIRRPVQHVISSQATACVAMIGGISTAEVKDFELKGIVSFRRAFAEASGSLDVRGGTHTTSVRVVVEGLNVLDVISADRVIARLSSLSSPQDPEPRIVASGTYFENLKISGEPVEVKLSKFFDEQDTFAKFEQAFPNLPNDLFRNRHARYPSAKDVYRVSLVEGVSLRSAHRLKSGGSTIEVADFGRIHLAEFFIQPSRRQLNMLRMELGSPVGGNLLIASASCNGLGGDPGTDDD
jgi:hypothetical protein